MFRLKTPILICLFLLSFSSKSNTYTVLSYDGANPPYSYFQQGQIKGIFPDIFTRISELTGHEFKFIPVAVGRGQQMFDRGLIDIEPGINPIWRQTTQVRGIYSQEYMFSHEVVLSRTAETITQPEQLYGKIIGAVRGYRYGEFERHFASNRIVKVDNLSESLLLAQLHHGFIDYVLIGDVTAYYFIKQNPQYRDFHVIYQVSKLPVSMRMQPKLKTLHKDINLALETMIQNDEFTTIYNRYIYSPKSEPTIAN
ncbi:substrate-binding periplasmic protein [Pseudoalteromonas ulvae]|uniref:substrate-binding periplasmic protein n=1 Tax=Pseudoalteromonas ulvae TaxID=107327 RepID=UPI001FD3D0C2|nr:transporter substrate-binding domain-containing protein [Pseudoalteromonas ulvae]